MDCFCNLNNKWSPWQCHGDGRGINHKGNKSPEDPPPLFHLHRSFLANNKSTVSLNASTVHFLSPPSTQFVNFRYAFNGLLVLFAACVCVSLLISLPLLFLSRRITPTPPPSLSLWLVWLAWLHTAESLGAGTGKPLPLLFSFFTVRRSLNKSVQWVICLSTCLSA